MGRRRTKYLVTDCDWGSGVLGLRSFKMMYEGLAELVIENLDFRRGVAVILEAGCGSGKLTLPLLQRIRKVKRNFRYIAYDISSGPYLGSLQDLRRKLRDLLR